MNITEQVCCRCTVLKPIEEFDWRKGRPKPSTVCKACRRLYMNEKAAEYRAVNPEASRKAALASYHRHIERRRETQRQRHQAAYVPHPRAALPLERPCKTCGVIFPLAEFQHPRRDKLVTRRNCRSCHRDYHAEQRRNNPEAERAKRRCYAEKHMGKLRERHRIYRLNNPEKFVVYNKRSYLKHREKRLAEVKRYKKANPLMYKLYHYRREARKRQAAGIFTAEDLKYKLEMTGGRCYYCGSLFTSTPHLEHKIPLSRGGTNWPANLTYACAMCNTRKHTKTVKEFRAWLLLMS